MGRLTKGFPEDYIPVHRKLGMRKVYRSILVDYVILRRGRHRMANIEDGDLVTLHHDYGYVLSGARLRVSSPRSRFGAHG